KTTRRPDGVDKVTGRARYGDDMRLPGMLEMRILRSPHAHARILSIDTSGAMEVPGVKAVLTHKDLPDHEPMQGPFPPIINDMHDITRNCMAREKVLYDGHAVAAVAATSEEAAREGVKRIKVEYEVLEPILDPYAAAQPGAPLLHEDMVTLGDESGKPSNIFRTISGSRGDVEAGFAEADLVIERTFTSQPVHQGYIEPLVSIAATSEDGAVDLYTTTQGHFVIRALTAKCLKMDLAMLRVIPSEIGGGFGGKNTIYGEPVAIQLSRMTGRPVRWVMSRSEVMRASGPTVGSHCKIRMGAKKDGTIVAAEAEIWYQAGAFKGSPVGRAADTFFSPYNLANMKVDCHDVVVNRPKVAAYRAPGAPMACFAAEGVINELAAKLGVDPIEMRRKNAIKEGDKTLMGTTIGHIGLNEVLDTLQNHPHNKAPLGPNQGRGVALGYWMHGGGLSSVTAILQDDGTISIATGNPDIGGSRSSMRAMAAEELGIDIERIKPIVADTGSLPYSHLTAGSRTTFATGWAVVNATREVIEKLRALAAKVWEIDIDKVTWEGGQAVPDPGAGDGLKPLSLKELAARATKVGGAIAGHSEINAGGVGAAFSAHLVDVEVDPDTGFTSAKRYTVVQDVGRAISPDYVEGQIQGGAVQGIGWALNEEYVYDKDAKLLNTGFLDYRMPVASDVPMIDAVLVEVPNPNHPYGVRGVGEPCLVPAPAAVANAVENAVGLTMSDLPLSPPKVLKAVMSAAAGGDD
ncbi:MAG: xanthine dehydrogenase family protein molybdopterin-binding subunit, partial [Rhodospirillaceae bacterium]